MGFFDDPATMALFGAAQGFGQAAMPSRLPVPLGAALGMGLGGMAQGQQQAIQNQALQAQTAGTKLGTLQQIQNYNMLAPYFGYKPVTADQLGMKGFAPMGVPPQSGTQTGNSSPAAAMAPAAASTASLFGGTQPQAPPQATSQNNMSPSSTALGNGAAPAGGASDQLRQAIMMRMLGIPPTPYQSAKIYASQQQPGSPEETEAQQAAAKEAGIDTSPQVRTGGVQLMFDPNANGGRGGYKPVFKNPNLPETYTLDDNNNAVQVSGGQAALQNVATTEAAAKAQFEPLAGLHDAAGNEIIAPKTALQTGLPGQSVAPPQQNQQQPGIPYAQRVQEIENATNAAQQPGAPSSAGGPQQFLDGTWLEQVKKFFPPDQIKGMTDQQLLALKQNPQVSSAITNAFAVENGMTMQKDGIKNIGAPELYLAHWFGPGGAEAILRAPPNTPIEQALGSNAQQILQSNPKIAGHTTGEIYASLVPAFRGVSAPQFSGPPQPQARNQGQQSQTVAPAASGTQPTVPPAQRPGLPAATNPGTPVQNSNLGIPSKLSDFISQLGPNYQPPGRAAAPAGTLMGAPNEAFETMQKDDADRVEQYSKEAAGGQKVYTNLQQLYQILGRGLSTGNMTGEATNLTNYARQLGLNNVIPKNFDPNDAGAFNKLATDLVFSQLKQIGGRPMVSEIEGLKQANPNVGMTPAANMEVLTNILADQRWRDARANLGRQYLGQFGSLGDFDAQFNAKYPQVDAYNRISQAAQQSGWQLPGSPGTPSGGPKRVVNQQVQAQISDENIAHTAKVNNMTVAQVKALLAQRGYQVQ